MGANVLQEKAINNFKIEMLTLIYKRITIYIYDIYIYILNIHSDGFEIYIYFILVYGCTYYYLMIALNQVA